LNAVGPLPVLQTLAIFSAAAAAEIAGCFAFWAWLRMDKSSWWLVPGIVSLVAFAYMLTRIDSSFAGRAYAAYGGVYIVSSLLWLWGIEGQRPDGWDVLGGVICMLGAAIILFGPRSG
tara:strand:- start:932 stop:1285 length:354 start_codon:yes stop_codon:yes gene_type:complete